MGFQPVYSKGPRRLLCPGSRAARGKITMSCIFNCLNYCEKFTEYIHIYKCASVRGLETQGLRRFK